VRAYQEKEKCISCLTSELQGMRKEQQYRGGYQVPRSLARALRKAKNIDWADEVSTESGSDRVSIYAKVNINERLTRSLPLSVLTPCPAVEAQT